MKKLLSLILIVFYAGTLLGQKSFDILLKSKALIESGKASEAVNILTNALEQSQDGPVYLQRAEAYIAIGDYSRAINDLNTVNNIAPASGEYGLARIYGLKGDAATSLYHLELCLKSAFKRSEKDVMLDPAFSMIDSKPEWRQFWKKEWYDTREKSLSELEYYISTGNIEEARNIQSLLSREYPESTASKYSYAAVALAESKYTETVKTIYDLLAEDPDNEKYLRLSGKAQEASGNFAGASDSYTKLLENGVADADLLLKRAECYRKTGELGKAIKDVDTYIELYPESQKALSMAGKLEAANGDNLKAMEYFSTNLKLHPSDPQCYIDRANSYFISRSWDWAIKDYSMSLDLKPENSEVWLNKGIALLNSGKVSDACYDFRRAFGLGNKKSTDYISRYCIK
jgi:tetratricopeptide (TPR) repeat protein